MRLVRESAHPVAQVWSGPGDSGQRVESVDLSARADRGPRNHKGRGVLLLRGAAEEAVPWEIGSMQNGKS